MIVRETAQDTFEELTPGLSILVNGVNHPWQITTLWDGAKLAALGVYDVDVPDVPEGKTEVSYVIERVEGVVTYVPTYEDIPQPEPPAPGMSPPTLVAAVLNANIAGNDIASVTGIYNLAAVMYIDVGMYMLFFMVAQQDTDYDVVINGGAPIMIVDEKSTDYVTILAKDAVGGTAVDPLNFGVQVYRV